MEKILFAALALSALAGAHAQGHYMPGSEGIQAATLPGPGTYYIGSVMNYAIEKFQAPGSGNALPGESRGNTLALFNRVRVMEYNRQWDCDTGVEGIVPLQSSTLTINATGVSDSQSGRGDTYMAGMLSCHGTRWDSVAAVGLWVNSAESHSPASPSKGFNSTVFTAGATYYPDADRTISGSALLHYEVNSRKSDGFLPGDQLALEWGIAKDIRGLQLGLVGYDQWQVSTDGGPGSTPDLSSRHALGAELVLPLSGVGAVLKAAAYQEYLTRAGSNPEPQGNLVRITFVKAF